MIKYYVYNIDTNYVYVLELMNKFYRPLELVELAGQRIRILGYA